MYGMNVKQLRTRPVRLVDSICFMDGMHAALRTNPASVARDSTALWMKMHDSITFLSWYENA